MVLFALLLLPSLLNAETEIGARPISGLGEGRVVCENIPPLRYPSAITDGSQGGTVLVRVFVDEEGRIYDTELVESDLPELFIVEALKTARLSRFRPARKNGQAMRGNILLPMVFAARDPDSVPIVTESAPASVLEPVSAPVLEPEPEPEPESAGEVEAETPEPAANTEPTASDEFSPRILDAGFGKGVQNRELLDRGEIFNEGDRVYFWMEIDDARPDQVLTHAWIFRGRAVQEIELTMKAERWRSWSYKTLFPGLEGAWLLELRDDTGRLLGSWSFHCE